MNPPPRVSVAFPVWNEEANLRPLYTQVREALLQAGVAYELVFVDNGSTDGSLNVIKEIAQSDPAVRYVSLSRNFGHQGALLAGLKYSRGAAVITMDADLQHPPALIPEMVRQVLLRSDVRALGRIDYEGEHLPKRFELSWKRG